jgi:hypothetical protein
MTSPENAEQSRRSDPAIPCPSCGAAAAGRFCTQCGAVVREAQCSACGVALTPGSKFCHECGTSVAAPVTRDRKDGLLAVQQRRVQAKPGSNLPWVFGGLSFVTLAIIFAAQRAGQVSMEAAPVATRTGAPMDISSMTPQERASRLFDRIMRLAEEGKRDSVELFASMAIPVYESLGPLDLDGRYDLGRIAQVSGQLDLARAQADTMLRQAPDHLLGLILAATVAELRGDRQQRAAYEGRLLAAERSELAKDLPEYTRHRADIDVALAAARNKR